MFDLSIYYRMVGGFIGTGQTQLGRIRWAVTMGCYMAFACVVHHEPALQTLYVFLGVTVGTFLGRMIPHGLFQATASLVNSLGMSAINVVRLALIVAPYALTIHDGTLWLNVDRMYLAAFGVFGGVAYFIGNKWLNNKDVGIYFRNTHTQWRIQPQTGGVPVGIVLRDEEQLDQCAVGGSEWGELLEGQLVYELMFLCALVLP